MNALWPALGCIAVYALAYRLYARFLAQGLFGLNQQRVAPSHILRDDVDYVPTRRSIVFGHHFASIAGLGPLLGPAVAVLWGWLPAMLWVVLGAVLVGCVHDFSALVMSLRARGFSMGKVAEGVLGPRAKTLFHLVIFFGIALAMGVFVYVLGRLLALRIDAHTDGYPGAVVPSVGLMVLAMGMGYFLYKRGAPLAPLAAGAFLLSLGLMLLGHWFPTAGLPSSLWPQAEQWSVVLLGYALLASILPVWVLLQARDFINSMLLYLGMAAAYLGFFLTAPTFQAPALRTQVEGAPGMLPFVFIIIACGAASGFHGLVSSGTTAKQLDKETDARSVGYGGMLAESLLGLLAVLACTAGFGSTAAWQMRYHDWHSAQGLAANISAFIDGAAHFIARLGVSESLAASFIAVVVVSFALTTLDSATRLLRYNIEEMGQTAGFTWASNRYISSGAAVAVIALFAFYEVNGQPAALALWTLFGTTNQLLAGLTLLTATLYLRQRGKPVVYTGLPALFVLASTWVAMVSNLQRFWQTQQMLLFAVGLVLFGLAAWIVAEAWRTWRQGHQALDWEIILAASPAHAAACNTDKVTTSEKSA